jgi:hypothetical protein
LALVMNEPLTIELVAAYGEKPLWPELKERKPLLLDGAHSPFTNLHQIEWKTIPRFWGGRRIIGGFRVWGGSQLIVRGTVIPIEVKAGQPAVIAEGGLVINVWP